ncbi:Transposase and inactivated derivatives, IS30 family [Arthrobacter subterraneus]|uniref:Transposase and inactivated derivatives, IS30 family n=1 Tax=Arthrobacter subterraneus TaxID=335973 RepID=A0A1G8FHC5_9MICC|nr:Transposase and inactivated derivatives, IS30 family [Arthrobacter subterraneus]
MNASARGEQVRRNRKYTQADKDRFFAAMDRVDSVSEAARQVGMNRGTCFNWARSAGMLGLYPNQRKHQEFLRFRAAGLSRREAAAAAGVHRNTAIAWDKGLVLAKGGARKRRRPVPQLAYNQEVASPPLAGLSAPDMAPAITHRTGMQDTSAVPAPAGVSQQAVEKVISARYFSQTDREQIADLLKSGSSVRAAARVLGRSPSSISREITRNSHPVLGYQPYGAHRASAARRARPKESKLAAAGMLREYVKDKLLNRWSPEQISRLLPKDYPDDLHLRVSHETIYQALYIQSRGGLKREVKTALRTGRTRRKTRRNPEQRTPRFVDDMINISERPPEIEDRAVPGHWEGDLITGAFNQSAIGTLVERTTRYVMLVHLPVDHTATSVRDGLIKTMTTLPEHLRGSLTWDQGSEMALHKAFSLATDMDVYFCDPASPWQRGSNENTNGLLRQYFPKGTDLNAYGPEDLEHVAQQLNSRPRKTLNWDTPAQRLHALLTSN